MRSRMQTMDGGGHCPCLRPRMLCKEGGAAVRVPLSCRMLMESTACCICDSGSACTRMHACACFRFSRRVLVRTETLVSSLLGGQSVLARPNHDGIRIPQRACACPLDGRMDQWWIQDHVAVYGAPGVISEQWHKRPPLPTNGINTWSRSSVNRYAAGPSGSSFHQPPYQTLLGRHLHACSLVVLTLAAELAAVSTQGAGGRNEPVWLSQM